MLDQKMSAQIAALAILVCTAVPPQAYAHHGAVGHPTLYLAENLIEFEGEITAVLWRNPHPRMRMSVTEGNGEEAIWELELNSSPIGFTRRGISADDFVQVGDQVRVAGVVAMFDAQSLGVLHYLRPDGREYINGNRELRWSNVEFTSAVQAIDPAKIAAAEQSAQGIFRVWGGNVRRGGGAHPAVTIYQPYLTERGAEMAAAWNRATDDAELDCRQGLPGAMFDPTPIELVDAGDRILVLGQEYDIERTIYLNADAAIVEPGGSALGHSVGRWDGDTLVVTTTNINWPQFDPFGTPQSDQAEYLETFRFSAEDNTLHYSFTSTDPVMFTQPITLTRQRRWTPGIEIVPFNCIAKWEDDER
jgi:hypothetical protein